MSQENVEIVRQMWEAFLGEDPVSGLAFCDPDIEWDGTNLPDGKVARGHEAIVEHAMRWAEMWDDWRMEPERFIDAGGDQVVLVFREIGRSEAACRWTSAMRSSTRCETARSSTERVSPIPTRLSKPWGCRRTKPGETNRVLSKTPPRRDSGNHSPRRAGRSGYPRGPCAAVSPGPGSLPGASSEKRAVVAVRNRNAGPAACP